MSLAVWGGGTEFAIVLVDAGEAEAAHPLDPAEEPEAALATSDRDASP